MKCSEAEIRLKRILRRQTRPGWGKHYIPGQLATRDEAPSSCRPIRQHTPLLQRAVHLLGRPEQAFGFFALYLPNLFELHEQRMLSLAPRPHPLSGHPKAAGLILKPLKGTSDVARRLHFEHIHQLIRVTPPDDPSSKIWVAAPFLGDLLLFLQDDIGPYCVNLNIKLKKGDHERAFGGTQSRDPLAARLRATRRMQLEIVYYGDADIPTHAVALNELDKQLVNNLIQLHGWHVRTIAILDSDRKDLETAFLEGLEAQIPPIRTIAPFIAKGIDEYVCRAVFHQAIWRRRLRVDLFKPIVIDKPLRREIRDVLDVYACWIRRPE